MYYTYMIRCIDNSIYTGITTDVKRRWNEHVTQGDKCAKYTLRHRVKNIEAVWESKNRILASKLEFQIKNLEKKDKEKLIKTKNLSIFFEDKLDCNSYNYFEIKDY